MAAKCQRQSFIDKKAIIFICLITIVFYKSYVIAGEGAGGRMVDRSRYRVVTLKHISKEQAKKYLAEAKVECVASSLPTPNTLLITADGEEIAKASSILKVADSEQEYVVKEILPAEERDSLPSNEAIMAEIGQISIGTFIDVPTDAEKPKAIIDVHRDSVIAVMPAGLSEAVLSAISRLQKAEAEAPAGGEPSTVTGPAETMAAVEPSEEAEPAEAAAVSEPERIEMEKAIEESEGDLELETAIEKVAAAEGGDVNEPMPDELFDELLEAIAYSQSEAEAVKAEETAAVAEAAEPAASEEVIEDEILSGIEEEEGPEVPTAAEKIVREEEIEEEAEKIVKEEKEEREEEIEIEPEEVEVAEDEEAETAAEDAVAASYAPEYTPLAEEELELDLPESLNLIDLLDLVGKYLRLDYMYNVADLKGRQVSLKVQGPIKVKELYPMLESVMKFTGFVMSRKDNFVTIVPAARMMEIDPTLGTVKYGDVVITRIFDLEYVDATSAQNLLTGMKLGTDIKPVPETGTLIVTDYAYRMERIEELLSMLDRPGKEKTFSFRTLKYTMATVLAPQVQKLAGQLGTMSITVAAPPAPAARTPAARRRSTPAKPPTPAKTTPSEVYLEADERTNRILMIGFEEQLLVINELIDALDVEQQDLRTMRLYEIQHVDASDVVDKLNALGIISVSQASTRGTGRTATAAGRSPEARAPAPAAPAPVTTTTTTEGVEKAVPVEEPQLVIIESTNSLLVNATAGQHIQIATIIGYLDREVEKAQIPYVVYPLENQDPVELINVLLELIQETVVEEADKEAKIQKTTTKKKIEEDITIVADPETYSLIVYASKKNQQWIAALIKELDAYRPQVLLDVTLVEITKTDEFNYDLSVISSFPDLVNTSGLTGTIIGGESPILSSDIINKLDAKGMDRFIDLQSVGGASTAFYGDQHIHVLLTAMQQKNYGRILAKPKLLVNDNQAGTIKSQETIHITREKVTYRKGPLEEDIPITEKEFLPYDAGITLDIEPHISKGDQLKLKITMTRKDFRITEEVKTEKKPPDVVTSDVTTVVTVPDGTTIILGGLERLSQSKGGSKVPILGDIPFLGGLFRSTANTDSQNRLYVFVKAHILRPGTEQLTGESDVEMVSRKNRNTFEKYEQEMQEYEDWPGIKPKPMDPVQILEEDVR